MPKSFLKALVCGTGMLTIAGCGGGGGSAAPAGDTAVVTPIPMPTPTPAPPPAPPPAPTPPPSAGTTQLVGAAPGQTLAGLIACAKDPVVKNSTGHVTALPVLTGAKIDNSVTLLYRGPDSYVFDLNGFGGPAFAPADKRTSPTVAFDQFITPAGDELQIAKINPLSGTRTFVTHGMLNQAAALCFFGVGLPAVSLPTGGSGDYFVVVDGIAQIGGQNLRLLPSYSGSSLTVNFQTGAASLHLNLSGRSNAFEEFANQASTNITSATATLHLDLAGPGFVQTGLTGSGGFSGTIIGSLVGDTRNTSGNGGPGAVFTFELRNAAGEVIFGVITAEQNLI